MSLPSINFSAISPRYLFAGLTAFLFTLALTRLALWLFPRIGLMDRPARYGLTRQPIPYYGGLAMFFAFIFSVVLYVPFNAQLFGVMIGLLLIVSVSFLDDMFQVRPWIRLLVQSLAAIIISLFGVGIRSLTNPFGGVIVLDHIHFALFGYDLVFLGLIFTILWVIFVVNSMNFFDGVPGLLSGISLIAFVVLFLLSLRTGQVIDQRQFIYLSVILAGICGAFVFFDFPTPKILMGDTGSMFLGFLLAVSALFAGGKVATVFIVLGIPLFDALWSIIRRIASGKSPFSGDLNHLHHRLLRAGFSQRQVLLIMYGISGLFGCITLFLSTYQKMLAMGAIIFSMILLSLLLCWRMRKRP